MNRTRNAGTLGWRVRLQQGLGMLVLLSLGFFGSTSRGAAPTVDDAGSGSLLLRNAVNGEVSWALRQSTRIRATVTGNVARVIVVQEFTNSADEWVEGMYVFPLSTTAAVDELQMQIGERRIRGEIQRKAEARATYERARVEGRQASLVEQQRPNLFTTAVANIAPKSSVTIEIAYLDTIAPRDGRYTLALPLAITPRYHPGEPAQTEATPEPTLELVDAKPQRIDIDVQLAPGFAMATLESLHHPIKRHQRDGQQHVVLSAKHVPADRDFELVWTPVVAPELHAAVFSERSGDDTFAIVTLTPPQRVSTRSLPREVLFIIDTSGSMSGTSIDQARVALWLGIERLTPADRFNIIRFSNDASSLFRTMQPVNIATRMRAGAYIAGLDADGGTEMRSALELAFTMPVNSETLRQIVFITDGSVGNESDLVGMIHQRIQSARLFTVGIGSAPNAYFMREAAAAGRGSHLFIADAAQVTERMTDLFRKLEQPTLVDLELRWPDGLRAELAADLPRDLYAGDPLVVAVKLPREPRGLLTLSGRGPDGPWMRQLAIQKTHGEPGLAKLWARERIGALARRKNFGGPDSDQLEQQITALALAHHLVSDYTSLVAVDVTPVRPLGSGAMPLQVPGSAPAGTAWARSTGFAPTATPGPLLLWIGALLLAAAMLWVMPALRRVRA